MRRSAAAFLVSFALAGASCDGDPTEATVVNELSDVTIDQVWFRTTLFVGPFEPGQSSAALRVGTGTEPAYAVVRAGDVAYVARTVDPVVVAAGESVRIVFSPSTARSRCFGAPPLTEEEHAFIASRIFPGEELAPYDAAICPE